MIGLRQLLNRKANRQTFPNSGFYLEGPFPTWGDAVNRSAGYDVEVVINAVESAMAKVRDGNAAMERDGVALSVPDFPFPLLVALLSQANRDQGNLRVLDFGGSLGSSYRTCRTWLDGIRHLKWGIVEQAHFVRRGMRHHQTEELFFFETIDDCVASIRPNIVLFSGVAMYLENLDTILNELVSFGAETVVVDRTLVSTNGEKRIFVEHVQMPGYSTSYPCACLPLAALEDRILGPYAKITEFIPVDHAPAEPAGLSFFGAVYRLKKEV